MAECFVADGVAVITGGASGIGRAAARRAAAAGMKIALVDINAAKLADMGAELAGIVGHDNLVVERLDVSDPAAMLALAQQVNAKLVASGISEALITTATGLVVAIPATIGYNYFVSAIDRFVIEMEETSAELIDELERING